MARTVLIVDDQPDVRLIATQLLEADGFAVVGEAGDLRNALAGIATLRPDVVLLDVHLPDGSGVDLARTLQAWDVSPMVVLMSTADYADVIGSCGAAGFIPKRLLSGATLRAAIGAS
ncbi:MAG: response regulator [Ilumatobacteraceae bacterium]